MISCKFQQKRFTKFFLTKTEYYLQSLTVDLCLSGGVYWLHIIVIEKVFIKNCKYSVRTIIQ